MAHEFFDALPHHKFIFKNGEWREKLITVGSSNDVRFEKVTENNILLKSEPSFIVPNLIINSGKIYKLFNKKILNYQQIY